MCVRGSGERREVKGWKSGEEKQGQQRGEPRGRDKVDKQRKSESK